MAPNGTESDKDRNSEAVDAGSSGERETIYRSDEAGIPSVEPATIAGEPETGEPRRRGRPRGSRATGSTSRSRKETSSDLSGLLVSLHFMASVIFSVKELEIEPPEAKKISDAVLRINELYSGIVLPEKALAWVQLAIACGTVYGPRMVAYNQRIKKEKAEGKRPITIDAVPVVN